MFEIMASMDINQNYKRLYALNIFRYESGFDLRTEKIMVALCRCRISPCQLEKTIAFCRIIGEHETKVVPLDREEIFA